MNIYLLFYWKGEDSSNHLSLQVSGIIICSEPKSITTDIHVRKMTNVCRRCVDIPTHTHTHAHNTQYLIIIIIIVRIIMRWRFFPPFRWLFAAGDIFCVYNIFWRAKKICQRSESSLFENAHTVRVWLPPYWTATGSLRSLFCHMSLSVINHQVETTNRSHCGIIVVRIDFVRYYYYCKVVLAWRIVKLNGRTENDRAKSKQKKLR